MSSESFLPEESAVLPRSLRDRLGAWRRLRCLSSRDAREVHLVEDGLGTLRVFKIHRGLHPETLSRFQKTRESLKGIAPEMGLLPILDYGLEPVHGLAWEEFPVADALDPGSIGFDAYSPVSMVSETSDSASSAARASLELVRALEFLHSRGLVHGDVKPANVLRWGGRWFLSDYDTLGEVRDAGRIITASTEGYCPPGECEGPDRDLYALGKLVYELWSGNNRFEYPSIPQRLTGVGTWSAEDRLINRLIEALCHPVGLNRLNRLEVVRGVLESVETGGAARLSRGEALLRPRGRRPVIIGLGSAAGLALGGGILLNSGWFPALPIVDAWVALYSEGMPRREPTEGLVAYYPLDGDAQDHSGLGHHGTAFKVSWSADASKAPRRAAHFNGEAGISIPEFPGSEAHAHTLSLWAKADSTKHHGKFLIKDTSVGDRDSPGRQWGFGWYFGIIENGVWVQPEGSTNRLRGIETSPELPAGRWIHLVQTWNGRSLEFWIDGRRLDSVPAMGRLAEGDSPVRIGWDQYYFFKGDIDEVRIYDRALSDDEVRAVHRLGVRRAFQGWWSSGAPY